jgi:mono/diheme cytochrome c family protein
MSKLLKRVALGLVALVVLIVLLGITFVVGWRYLLFGPRARDLRAQAFLRTPARLERGRHLVEDVYSCAGCHSPRDWTQPGAPAVASLRLAGMHVEEDGFALTLPNLTPDPETGTGRWSDDALSRAIREGIGHDGRALFPMMPYEAYRGIPDEDVEAMVVYLKSLAPIRNPLPATKLPFPLPLLIRSVPQPIEAPVPAPDLATPVKRGEFLVRTIDCAGCHTPKKQGQPIEGLDLAGGFALQEPVGRLVSTNITPDASGIPYYDEALFLEMMRTGHVKGRQISPVMPWVFFKNLPDDDLKAMFAYLQTLPPVKHRVNNQDPPTACKRCGEKHGLGDQNP